MILRPYQQECIDHLYAYWTSGKGSRPVIVAPCGSGKSAIIAGFCEQTIKQWPEIRILIVTDSKEIVSQNEKELKRYWPNAPTGIFSAGLKKRELESQITFAGIQSIYKRMFEFYPPFSVICIDEAHAVSRESDTMYGELIKNALLANPDCGIWGTTGTPYRLDQGIIWEGKNAIFDGCAHEIKIKYLIDNNYLCPIISKGGLKRIDLTGVKIQAGEYNQTDLAMAADNPEIIKSAVDEIITYGSDRKSWMIFCAGVKHAQNVLLEIKSRGIEAGIVTGEMDNYTRDTVIRNFRDGKIKAIISVNVLTKGVNIPECDLIALLTATRSTAKYVQMAGRGLRIAPGKENCLLLDMANNVMTHGELDNLNPKKIRNVSLKYEAPVKECPDCKTIIHSAIKVCYICGYKYPESEPTVNHGYVAYDGAVLTDQIKPKWLDVTDVTYSRHQKEGKPDSVKVTFSTTGGLTFPMWLAIEHKGYATTKALQYIGAVGGTETTVDSILKVCQYYKKPKKILIRKNGKFYDILQIDIAEDATEQKELF